jgi:hypothetical protein
VVLAAAREEWGEWRQAFDEPPIKLTFGVRDEDSELIPSAFQSQGHTFSIEAGTQSTASGDTRARVVSATVTRNAAADRGYLIYHFLDAMAYPIVTAAHLTPMHAGCVARDASGVLLCGDSHSGKSTLAYACARTGWTFVSDDASPLLRREAAERTVLGGPHRIRLRPDARDLFPELTRFEMKLRGNGKVSLQIPTRELQIATAARTRVDAIVLLRREPSGSPRLQPMEKDHVRKHCEKWFAHWDAEVYAEPVAAFEIFLSGVRAYSLEYSDFESAVTILNDAV